MLNSTYSQENVVRIAAVMMENSNVDDRTELAFPPVSDFAVFNDTKAH